MTEYASDKTWWGRNWKWVVPVGCLLPLLACGGCIAGVVFIVFGAIRTSEPYTHSLERVQADPRVQAALGAPIEAGWMMSGQIEVSGPSGEADLSYSVAGPKGSATVYVDADKAAGEWTYNTLAVQIDETGERIDLMSDPGLAEEMP
jgi:hypothetical protein